MSISSSFISNRLAVASAFLACAAGGAFAVASATAESKPEISALSNLSRVDVPAEVAQAISLSALDEWAPQARSARALDVAGETWTVFDGIDGALCVDIGDVTITCDDSKGIEEGDFGLTEIAPPSEADQLRLAKARAAGATAEQFAALDIAPTKATRRSIVVDGIASVRALSARGEVLGAAQVKNNGYVLGLGLEGEAQSIELLDAEGRVVNTVAAY